MPRTSKPRLVATVVPTTDDTHTPKQKETYVVVTARKSEPTEPAFISVPVITKQQDESAEPKLISIPIVTKPQDEC